MNVNIERLMQLMRPPIGGGDLVDWAGWKSDLGFDFPLDFKDFMEVYGAGTINLSLSMFSLLNGGREWLAEYEDAPCMFQGVQNEIPPHATPYPTHAGQGGLVLWGISSRLEYFFWFADGSVPDKWPVAVYSRSAAAWMRYDGGFASYLLDVLTGELRSSFDVDFPKSVGPDFLGERDRIILRNLNIGVSRYVDYPQEVIAQIQAAGLNPVDFFPSATRYL